MPNIQRTKVGIVSLEKNHLRIFCITTDKTTRHMLIIIIKKPISILHPNTL